VFGYGPPDAVRRQIDAVPVALAVLEPGAGPDGTSLVVTVNAATETLTGFRHDDVAGRAVGAVLAGAAAEALEAACRDCAAAGAPVKVEDRVRLPVGDRWVVTTLSPLHDAQGRIGRLLLTAVDVGRRRAAEAGREESERRLARLSAGLPGVLFEYARDRRGAEGFTYVGARAEEVLGVPAEEMLADPGAALRHVLPADAAAVRGAVRRAVRRSRPWRLDFRVSAGGGVRWLRGIASPSETAGGGVRYAGFVSDVTPEKAAEERLRDALETLGEGFVYYDRDRRLVVCNERYRRMYPLTAAQIVPGARFGDLVRAGAYAGQYPEAVGREEEFVAESEALFWGGGDVLMERQLADGRWLLVSQRRTSDGGSVGTRADITVLRRRERELQEARADLERRTADLRTLAEDLEAARREAVAQRVAADHANRAKSEFLAHVSHELRSPLNAILGFAEMLEGQFFGPLGDARYREYAGDIRQSGLHLLSIINDILDLAKVEAGQHELEEEIVPLDGLVEAAMRVVRRRAEDKGIGLAAAVGEGLRVRADGRALRQILVNLLTNAVKFTGRGGRVEAGAALRDDGWIAVHVRDTGVGIGPEHVDQVLTPFGQVGSSLVRQEDRGTGLGLPISKALAEAHGGGLRISSAPGEGTLVEVLLPPWRAVAEERTA
jgi:two-component system cell cycle sensor histidine kinase PleC